MIVVVVMLMGMVMIVVMPVIMVMMLVVMSMIVRVGMLVAVLVRMFMAVSLAAMAMVVGMRMCVAVIVVMTVISRMRVAALGDEPLEFAGLLGAAAAIGAHIEDSSWLCFAPLVADEYLSVGFTLHQAERSVTYFDFVKLPFMTHTQ